MVNKTAIFQSPQSHKQIHVLHILCSLGKKNTMLFKKMFYPQNPCFKHLNVMPWLNTIVYIIFNIKSFLFKCAYSKNVCNYIQMGLPLNHDMCFYSNN